MRKRTGANPVDFGASADRKAIFVMSIEPFKGEIVRFKLHIIMVEKKSDGLNPPDESIQQEAEAWFETAKDEFQKEFQDWVSKLQDAVSVRRDKNARWN